MPEISPFQFNLVYNSLSFTIAVMGAATLFFWLQRTQVAPAYRTALTLTGLVTFIAFYHYLRIFSSWTEAYALRDGVIVATGSPFNDAYRYVDWLLTVPLLLVELILVMGLSSSETFNKSIRLGVLAAVMILLGYPGEVAAGGGTRFVWWFLAMIPFLWIVYELFFGLRNSIDKQPSSARGLVSGARWLLVVSWAFYPIVYLFPLIGITGGSTYAALQIGYTVADIVSKAVFGVLIYMIAVRKSQEEMPAQTAGSPPVAAE